MQIHSDYNIIKTIFLILLVCLVILFACFCYSHSDTDRRCPIQEAPPQKKQISPLIKVAESGISIPIHAFCFDSVCVFSFASSAAYTPCCVFFEEKTDIHARLLHGYFLVSFFNYRFYEFKFSLRFFTVIINPVPERINSINSHTLGVLSPVLGAVTSFLSVPLDGLSSEESLLLLSFWLLSLLSEVFALMVNVVLAEPSVQRISTVLVPAESVFR